MRVVLITQTAHSDHLLQSPDLPEAEAREWLKTIDSALSRGGTETIETDWATVLRPGVWGAYLQD